jgi:hypothetical protein
MTSDCFQRLILSGALLLMPATVLAQSVSTGLITGVVRDTSGAVLPGVTVEAASPALIERLRSAVSDSSGVYRITDLRPGTYSVTFTLAGFSTLRRDKVELTTGFTATVNGDLAVGNLAETITVSGAAPTVDTQNEPQVDLFNILNASPILGITTRLGPAFNVPNNVLDPRLVKFGVNMTF